MTDETVFFIVIIGIVLGLGIFGICWRWMLYVPKYWLEDTGYTTWTSETNITDLNYTHSGGISFPIDYPDANYNTSLSTTSTADINYITNGNDTQWMSDLATSQKE